MDAVEEFAVKEDTIRKYEKARRPLTSERYRANLVTENEKPVIQSATLLSDRVADGSAECRPRAWLGAKCASHVHPQKPPALCAGQ